MPKSATPGQPLIKHQVIRHKLADMSARIDAMDAYLNQVAEVNAGEMPVTEISRIKFFCSTNLEFIASEATQIFGGAGYRAAMRWNASIARSRFRPLAGLAGNHA